MVNPMLATSLLHCSIWCTRRISSFLPCCMQCRRGI